MKEITIYVNNEPKVITVDNVTNIMVSDDRKSVICTLKDGSKGSIPAIQRTKDGIEKNKDINIIVDYFKSLKNKNTNDSDKFQPPAVIEIPDNAETTALTVVEPKADPNALTTVEFGDEAEEVTDVEDVSEKKLDKWMKWAARGILIGAAALLIACGLKSCSDKKAKTADEPATISDLKEDTRYTTISEEDLVKTTKEFKDALNEHGIEVTSDEALKFVTVANLTHLEATNPELVSEVFGSESKETIISETGHLMGQIVTNEITAKDDDASYWTVALIDKTDKAIADKDMSMISECKEMNKACEEEIAAVYADSTLTAEQKDQKIDEIKANYTLSMKVLVEKEFVSPNYDKTVGYEIDGEHTSKSQEDGAKFITNGMVTGILMGDQVLKNYVNVPGYVMVTLGEGTDAQRYGIQSYVSHMEQGTITEENAKYTLELDDTTKTSELTDDLQTISANETTVSNIFRIIESCQNSNTQNAKSYAK